MKKTGKILSIIGGVLAILGTWLFAWNESSLAYSAWGIINIQDRLTDIQVMGAEVQTLAYIMLVVFFLTIVSGVLILIGAKVRILAIIFGLIATFSGAMILISPLIAEGEILNLIGGYIMFPGMSDFIVEGIIPLIIPITADIYLGSIVLTAGGVLGLIGGITTKKD